MVKTRSSATALTDVLIPVGFMGFGVYVFQASSGLPAQPALFPKVFAVLLIVLSLGFAVLSTWKHLSDSQQDPAPMRVPQAGARRRFYLVGLSVLYGVSIMQFGFYLSSLFWLPVMFVSLGYRRYRSVTTVALVSCAVLYALFRLLLEVPTPVGEIFGF